MAPGTVGGLRAWRTLNIVYRFRMEKARRSLFYNRNNCRVAESLSRTSCPKLPQVLQPGKAPDTSRDPVGVAALWNSPVLLIAPDNP